MLLELLRKRRSIRQFEDRPVPVEKVELLLEAALRSPSSRSLNPWEFVVVEDKETIARLAAAKPHGATFMKNAPLAIVVIADPERCDVWVEDCSIAALLLHLQAADLGLGSCWVQIRKRDHNQEQTSEDYVKQQLAIPDNYRVEAVVAIGYPAERKPGHAPSTLLYNKVHRGSYAKPWNQSFSVQPAGEGDEPKCGRGGRQ